MPYAVESLLSGVQKPLLPSQRLWYRRTFANPSVAGQRVLLHFGAVDDECVVWVNGKQVGEHRGGYLPFTFDITDALIDGENELLISVLDSNRNGITTTRQAGAESKRDLVHGDFRHLANGLAGGCA